MTANRAASGKFIMLIVGIMILVSSCTKSGSLSPEQIEYKKICTDTGFQWMKMRPMLDAKYTSEEECYGCMAGFNHICNKDDFIEKVSNINGVSIENFSTVKSSEPVELKNGDVFQLKALPIVKEIAGYKVKMYSYNGQIPGPLLKVRQSSKIFVNFTNMLDMETTIHWHGIRVDSRFDGVPNVSQKTIMPKESFVYDIEFPDEGVYWYHPHVREDIQQELGLYGNIYVEPNDKEYFNKADSEAFIFLDDFKFRSNGVVKFGREDATEALSGRYGNVMFINGDGNYSLRINKGSVVRFFLTNAANARVFNLSIDEHKLKIAGGDSGKFEHEYFADALVIAPAERFILEVYFGTAGKFEIASKSPQGEYVLGSIEIADSGTPNSDIEKTFLSLKENAEIKNSISGFEIFFDKKPDYELILALDSPVHEMERIVANSKENIEWEDSMQRMNEMSTSKNTHWVNLDNKTGKKNMENVYDVNLGDIKKIRLINPLDSMHPMQHPMHLHGQRFLVIEDNGIRNQNLVWKDTVLVRKGSTVDLLMNFSNPGEWMIHCHIPEHLESGMMSKFVVR